MSYQKKKKQMASRRHFYLITIYNKIVLSYLSYLASYRQKRVINGVKSKFINYNLALGRTVGHFFSTYIREKKYTRIKAIFATRALQCFFSVEESIFFVLLSYFYYFQSINGVITPKNRQDKKQDTGRTLGKKQDTFIRH